MERFGRSTPLGRRRTRLGEAPSAVVVPLEALVEREPVTVYLSEKGWIRTVRGHQTDTADVKYKEGDAERFVVHAFTTDRLVLFASDGRSYTLSADKLPRGRGFGEPVRLMIDLGNEANIVALFTHDPARRLIVAASDGRGFLVREEGVAAQTRAGRQVLNVTAPALAVACAAVPEGADTVAVIASNRKLLCFPLDQLPEMARGRGVRLQKHKDARLEDVAAFRREEGLPWGRRILAGEDLAAAMGNRAQAGRLAPRGFPKTTRFT
jgi:topoisomerase-4 subunit A